MPRFTIDMDDKFNETLNRLANGGTKADVIRNAVATYQYLKAKVPDSSGPHHVSISDDDGVVRQVVILP